MILTIDATQLFFLVILQHFLMCHNSLIFIIKLCLIKVRWNDRNKNMKLLQNYFDGLK